MKRFIFPVLILLFFIGLLLETCDNRIYSSREVSEGDVVESIFPSYNTAGTITTGAKLLSIKDGYAWDYTSMDDFDIHELKMVKKDQYFYHFVVQEYHPAISLTVNAPRTVEIKNGKVDIDLGEIKSSMSYDCSIIFEELPDIIITPATGVKFYLTMGFASNTTSNPANSSMNSSASNPNRKYLVCSKGPGEYVFFTYTTAPLTVKGIQIKEGKTTNWDCTLTAGWNAVLATQTEGSEIYRTGLPDSSYGWIIMSENPFENNGYSTVLAN